MIIKPPSLTLSNDKYQTYQIITVYQTHSTCRNQLNHISQCLAWTRSPTTAVVFSVRSTAVSKPALPSPLSERPSDSPLPPVPSRLYNFPSHRQPRYVQYSQSNKTSKSPLGLWLSQSVIIFAFDCFNTPLRDHFTISLHYRAQFFFFLFRFFLTRSV